MCALHNTQYYLEMLHVTGVGGLVLPRSLVSAAYVSDITTSCLLFYSTSLQ